MFRLPFATVIFITLCTGAVLSVQAEDTLESGQLIRTHTSLLLDEFIGQAESRKLEDVAIRGPRTGSTRQSGDSFIWTQDDLLKKTKNKSNHGRLWKQQNRLFAASEPSTDGQHFFVQGYFGSVRPFTASPLLIWKHVQKTISLSETKENGGVQASAETYANQSGSIQEVAILLADWISASGFDARVVEGKKDGKRHTWVSILNKGTTYVIDLEESPLHRISVPRQSLRYNPSRAYNAEYLWVYSNQSTWQQVSRFVEDEVNSTGSKKTDHESQYRVTSDTPIMLSPLNTSRHVGVLKRGERIQILKSEGNWHHVVYRGEHTGYVPKGSTQRVL